MRNWTAILDYLNDIGLTVSGDRTPRAVGGGDISAAWHLETADGGVFMKTGPLSFYEMFSAEADGLKEIAAANALRVPAVRAIGQVADTAIIVLEWLPLQRTDRKTEQMLGERLAAMHRCTTGRFGWFRDNTIGLTPQRNTETDDWAGFFAEHRLGFQLKLAAEKGHTGQLQEKGLRLLQRLPALFEHYRPVPSLLHGDLWGGNWAASNGEPVIFDPAVYYGDRETDLAMTRLFGGFGSAFYEAYENAWPLQVGNHERQHLYQLYHVLNHLNLFGSGYLGRSLSLMAELL
jgi:fructosamine-3-kinase